jgi:arabinose-5-phosphate isomerase
MITDNEKICQLGREVIESEAQAILGLRDSVGMGFVQACTLMLNCEGRVIVMGMGKSGHIANKIAATLASTGTPAFFLHPGEASHGDVGNITSRDVVVALSYSGGNPEVLAIVPIIKKLKVPLVTLTGNPDSALARVADVNLDVSVAKEACPLGVVPTASTTAALVMGDALAVALLEARGFTVEDFAQRHPGGALGRQLVLSVDDIMHTGKAIPKVAAEALLSNALVEMTRKNLGMTTVVDMVGEHDKCCEHSCMCCGNDEEEGQRLLGIFTDGDLRRVLDRGLDVHKTKIVDVMTTDCKTVQRGTLAIEALQLMEKYHITSLVVIGSHGGVVGVVHMHDLLNMFPTNKK